MNELRFSIGEFGKLLFRRMKDAGIDLCPATKENNLHLPNLPNGWESYFKCAGDNSHHCCENHRLVRIPLVLVAHLYLPEINGLKPDDLQILESERYFEPYWLIDVTVIHDWVPYPNRPYRSLNVIEAACLLAQHPYLGSVQSHVEPCYWGHERIQVYRSPETGCIVADRRGIPSYNHHKAFTTGVVGLESPRIQKRVLVFSKKAAESPTVQSPPATGDFPPTEIPSESPISSPSQQTPIEEPMSFDGSIPPD